MSNVTRVRTRPVLRSKCCWEVRNHSSSNQSSNTGRDSGAFRLLFPQVSPARWKICSVQKKSCDDQSMLNGNYAGRLSAVLCSRRRKMLSRTDRKFFSHHEWWRTEERQQSKDLSTTSLEDPKQTPGVKNPHEKDFKRKYRNIKTHSGEKEIIKHFSKDLRSNWTHSLLFVWGPAWAEPAGSGLARGQKVWSKVHTWFMFSDAFMWRHPLFLESRGQSTAERVKEQRQTCVWGSGSVCMQPEQWTTKRKAVFDKSALLHDPYLEAKGNRWWCFLFSMTHIQVLDQKMTREVTSKSFRWSFRR